MSLRLDLAVEITFEPVRWASGGEGMIFQWRVAN